MYIQQQLLSPVKKAHCQISEWGFICLRCPLTCTVCGLHWKVPLESRGNNKIIKKRKFQCPDCWEEWIENGCSDLSPCAMCLFGTGYTKAAPKTPLPPRKFWPVNGLPRSIDVKRRWGQPNWLVSSKAWNGTHKCNQCLILTPECTNTRCQNRGAPKFGGGGCSLAAPPPKKHFKKIHNFSRLRRNQQL